MNNNVKRIVNALKKKYDTANPFEIARQMKVEYIIGPLGSRSGCYMYLKRHRCIFLNEELSEHEMKLVMAHELGHAVLHRTQNCYFIRHKTLLSGDRFEVEANKFAMELLIPDESLSEYSSCTIEQLSRIYGCHQKLIELRLK